MIASRAQCRNRRVLAGGECVDQSECTTIRGTGNYGRICLSFSAAPTGLPTRSPSFTAAPTAAPSLVPRIATPVVIVSFVAAADSANVSGFRCETIETDARHRFTAHMTQQAVIQTGLCTLHFLMEIYSPGGSEAGCAVRYQFQPETPAGETAVDPDTIAASLADAAVRWARLADYFRSPAAFPAGYSLGIAADQVFGNPRQSVTAVVATVDSVRIEVPVSEATCLGAPFGHIASLVSNAQTPCSCATLPGCHSCTVYQDTAGLDFIAGAFPCRVCEAPLVLLNGACIPRELCSGSIDDARRCIQCPPTPAPSQPPTPAPTGLPTAAPTAAPSPVPTGAPSAAPTPAPSQPPTLAPTTADPTPAPSTRAPTGAPTVAPTRSPAPQFINCFQNRPPCIADYEVAIADNAHPRDFRCVPRCSDEAGAVWNGTGCSVPTLDCADHVTCVAGLDYTMLCNQGNTFSDSFRQRCPISCGVCSPDALTTAAPVEDEEDTVAWGLTNHSLPELCQCGADCLQCDFADGVAGRCGICNNGQALVGGICIAPGDCDGTVVGTGPVGLHCVTAAPTTAPTITPICDERCSYDPATEYCKPRGSETPCREYANTESCPDGRCEWNAAYGCAAIEPPLERDESGEPVLYTSLRCDQIWHEVVCAQQDAHCEWDVYSATCNYKACDAVFVPEACALTQGCVFDDDLLRCHADDGEIPCDALWRQARCEEVGPRCEWHTDVSRWGACEITRNELLLPCSAFQDDNCPDRCHYDVAADTCIDADGMTVCTSYRSAAACPTAATEYRAGVAEADGQQICRRLSEPGCDEGEFQVAATRTSDRQCQRYSPECMVYFEFESQSQTGSSDRTCSAVTFCSDWIDEAATEDVGESETEDLPGNQYYEVSPATATSNTECARYTMCGASQYESSEQRWDADRACSEITDCDPDTEHIVVDPTATSDRVCAALTGCSEHQYIAYPHTTYFDRQCRDLTVCSADEYESSSPGTVDSFFVRNRACALLTVCDTWEYEHRPPSTDSDRVCYEVSPCNFETVSPTATSDRVCCDPETHNEPSDDDGSAESGDGEPATTTLPCLPVTTTPAPDICNEIVCSTDCSGSCGWSSRRSRCESGEETRDFELGRGDCPTTTLSPTVRGETPGPTAAPSTSPSITPAAMHTCISGGNAHYRTFDGLMYEWHGACDYILVKDCRPDGDGEAGVWAALADTTRFEVQTRNAWRQTPEDGTYITAAVVQLPQVGVLELSTGPNGHTLNGEPIALPYTDMHGNSVSRLLASARQGAVEVRVEAVGATVRWNAGTTITVWLDVTSPLVGETCGLCGDADSDVSNDDLLTGRREYWKVGEFLPTQFLDGAQCEEPDPWSGLSQGCRGNVSRLAEAVAFCGALGGEAYANCQGRGLPFIEMNRNCVNDHCDHASGESAGVTCEAFWMAEEHCRASGIHDFQPLSADCTAIPDPVRRPAFTAAPTASTGVPSAEELTLFLVFRDLSFDAIEGDERRFDEQVLFALIQLVDEARITYITTAASWCSDLTGRVVVAIQFADMESLVTIQGLVLQNRLPVRYGARVHNGESSEQDLRCPEDAPEMSTAEVQTTSDGLTALADPTPAAPESTPSAATTELATTVPATLAPTPPPSFGRNACNMSLSRCDPDDICSRCLEEVDTRSRAVGCFRRSQRFRNVIETCAPSCPEVRAARATPTDRTFGCMMTVLNSSDVTVAVGQLSQSCLRDPLLVAAVESCDESSFSTAPWTVLRREPLNAGGAGGASSEADDKHDLSILIIVVVLSVVMLAILGWSLGTFKKKQDNIIKSIEMTTISNNEFNALDSGLKGHIDVTHEHEFEVVVRGLTGGVGNADGGKGADAESSYIDVKPYPVMSLPNSASSVAMSDLTAVLSGKKYLQGHRIAAPSVGLTKVLSNGSLELNTTVESSTDDDLMETMTSSV